LRITTMRAHALICIIAIAVLCAAAEQTSKPDLLRYKHFDKRNVEVCPNNCNGHGSCTNDACVCATGWTGFDCTYAISEIRSGVSAEGNVKTFEWHYYEITSPTGDHRLEAEVRETSAVANGDCDLFIRHGALPTRSEFDFRHANEDNVATLSVPHAKPGVWYAGVLGFTHCEYIITLTIDANSCPHGCSGSGDCVDGTCSCYVGHTGEDCSTLESVLHFDDPKIGEKVDHAKWRYYQLVVDKDYANITIQMNETSKDTDCDIFIKKDNKMPTQTSWDYADASIHKNTGISVVHITEPKQTTYIIGVHGFSSKTCTYNIFALSAEQDSDDCPNKCSKHGHCNNGQCDCPGYTGDRCEERTAALSDAETVTGYVANFEWNYYKYESNSNNELYIAVSQAAKNSDCDVFVRAGQKPGMFSYDYSDQTWKEQFSITVPNAGHKTYYIGIVDRAISGVACEYTLTASESSACQGGCVHGTCDSGTCSCADGWSGTTCSETQSSLVSNVTITGSVDIGQWKYYTFSSTSSSVYFHLYEPTTEGYVWIFVNERDDPDLMLNVASAVETNKKIHRVRIDNDANEAKEYHVGVYGSPFLEHGPTQFQLVAFAPDF